MAGTSSGAVAHIVEVHTRWGDMDSLAHVNNVQVSRLFEEARIRSWHDWFSSTGGSLPVLIARQEIEYLAPLYYNVKPTRIEVWVSRIGEKSFDYAYLLRSHDGQVCALAETTSTAVDRQTGRPVAIPDDIRTILEQHSGDEVEFRRRR